MSFFDRDEGVSPQSLYRNLRTFTFKTKYIENVPTIGKELLMIHDKIKIGCL